MSKMMLLLIQSWLDIESFLSPIHNSKSLSIVDNMLFVGNLSTLFQRKVRYFWSILIF